MDASRRILALGGVGIALALILTPSSMAIQAEEQTPSILPSVPPTADQLASLLARLAEKKLRQLPPTAVAQIVRLDAIPHVKCYAATRE